MSLYTSKSISSVRTVHTLGGSGSYFDFADHALFDLNHSGYSSQTRLAGRSMADLREPNSWLRFQDEHAVVWSYRDSERSKEAVDTLPPG